MKNHPQASGFSIFPIYYLGAPMNQVQPQVRRISPAIKAIFCLISLVVVSVGVMAIVTSYGPPRSTRWGVPSAVVGSEARHCGSSVALLGLLPLLSLSRSPRHAAILGTMLAVALLANIFLGVSIWA